MARRGILVVEDDPTLRSAIQQTLEERGYTVTTACNGADALLILRHCDPPDVILLDLILPLISGWEVCAELAGDKELSKIPLVILSAIADRREAALLRVPPENCIKKPFQSEDLLSAIRRLAPRRPGTQSGERSGRTRQHRE